MFNKLRRLAARENARLRKYIYLIALLLLIIGIYISLQRSPNLVTDAKFAPILAVLLIGIPVTLAANSLRYIYSARLIEAKVNWRRALEVTTISTAANMLPLPGGTAVRITALSKDSNSIRSGVNATFISTMIWCSITLIFSGVAVALANSGMGLIVAGSGLAGLSFNAIYISFYTRHSLLSSNIIGLHIVELASSAIDALRFMLCLHALSVSVFYTQAAALVLASLVGSAISIVPAGLGVREITSAAIGPVVGITPEASFLSATLNRLLGLIGITPIAALFLYKEKDDLQKKKT